MRKQRETELLRLSEFEELVLLAILKLNNRTYGVPLKETLEEATCRIVSIGALYTTLSRVEEKGYLKSWMGEATPERGGRAKKYFQVTGVGERALQETEAARRRLQTQQVENWVDTGNLGLEVG